jgi:ABC-type antimicrobial peptide transport system permease subunit
MFVKSELAVGLEAVNTGMTIFTSFIAFIALVLAFFLLLISNTQNINDAIWEYGVLRSMGVTVAEGRRIYMYEATMIVMSSGILGIGVGVFTAWLMSYEFFIFLELDFAIHFPYVILGVMLVIAAVTTYLSVRLPVDKVNKKEIA